MIRPCGAPRDGGTAGRESGLGEQGEQDHPAHEGQEPEGGASQLLGAHTPPIGSNGSSVRSSVRQTRRRPVVVGARAFPGDGDPSVVDQRATGVMHLLKGQEVGEPLCQSLSS